MGQGWRVRAERGARNWALGLVLSTCCQAPQLLWSAHTQAQVLAPETPGTSTARPASPAAAPPLQVLPGGLAPIPYQEGVMNFLLAYGLGSVGVGGALWAFTPSPWREVGMQAVAWGGIDAALAQWGRVEAERKRLDPNYQALPDAQFLRTLFGWNALLDVGYVAGGAYLSTRPGWQGHGWGIMAQGVFLLGLDGSQWWHLDQRLKPAAP